MDFILSAQGRAAPDSCLSELVWQLGGEWIGDSGAGAVGVHPGAGSQAGGGTPLAGVVGDGFGYSLPGCDGSAPEDGALPARHVAPQGWQSISHS